MVKKRLTKKSRVEIKLFVRSDCDAAGCTLPYGECDVCHDHDMPAEDNESGLC